MEQKSNYWRELMRKFCNALLTWDFIFIVAITLVVAFVISGCSTFVSTTIGDTTYSTGVYLDKEVSFDETN